MAEKNENEIGLEDSLNAFTDLMKKYSTGVVSAIQQDGRFEDAEIAKAISSSIVQQTINFKNEVVPVYNLLSKEARNNIESFHKATGLEMLISDGNKILTTSSQQKGLLSGLFPGLGDLLEPIKKILKMILDLFGVNLPSWVSGLLDIINNLFSGSQARLSESAGKQARNSRENMYEHLQQMYNTYKSRNEYLSSINEVLE